VAFARYWRQILHYLANVCENLSIRCRGYGQKYVFQYGVHPPSWIFPMLTFGHIILLTVLIYVSVQNVVKYDKVSLKCGDFQHIAVVCHVGFSNVWEFSHCISLQNFAKIGLSAAELSTKAMFSLCRLSAILNLKIFLIIVTDCPIQCTESQAAR